jgi:hypothetical protein
MLNHMLMEELFSRGIMKMGPARNDPARQVGVFNMEFVSTLPALRLQELEKFRWIEGEWNMANQVPATRMNLAYTDIGSATYKLCEKNAWVCLERGGVEHRHITFDPFSRQWIYVLLEGAYGIMRSPGWIDGRIVFEGHVTMIGVECELRQTWTKVSDDEFRFVNEERLPDGAWGCVDEWEFRRK